MLNSDQQEIGSSMISWISILFKPTSYLGINPRPTLVYKNAQNRLYCCSRYTIFTVLKFRTGIYGLIFAILSQGISYIEMSPKCDQTKAKWQHICQFVLF